MRARALHPDAIVLTSALLQVNCVILRGGVESPDHAPGLLEVVEVPAPSILADADGPVDFSYINHSLVNGGVVACSFGDSADADARAILADAYPGRTVVSVDARPLFERGGGIHCITQHQPAV